jgi:hypothetical protein
MMDKVWAMLGFKRRDVGREMVELDRKIEEQRLLARLAKSELIENVFQGLSDEVARGAERQ